MHFQIFAFLEKNLEFIKQKSENYKMDMFDF